MNHSLVYFLVIFISGSSLFAQPNPYGVTGVDWREKGGMRALGMPEDCWAIHWGWAHPTNVPQMPRPCKPDAKRCQFISYHPATETIENATQFREWILANPGKVFVLGNEPDNPDKDGDGMTPESYAIMYGIYHRFIAPLDPTARFAVAGLLGDAVPGAVERTFDWWEQALAVYEERYGEPMPVDVWNYHCYAPPDLRNVEEYMALYVDPFCEWVRTVADGRYADAEIWCTEFGIGFWHGALNAKWVEPWMQRLLLRMENSPVNRWFWFLGHWDASPEGKWRETCLLDAGGKPTILGETYSLLANHYPNLSATPKPDPEPRPAPERFFADFEDGDVSEWIDRYGKWIAEDGAYRCSIGDATPWWWGLSTLMPYVYRDFAISADVKINWAPDPLNWVGFGIRSPGMFSPRKSGGHLVFFRQNGEMGLYTHDDKQIIAMPNVTDGLDRFHNVRIECRGCPAEIAIFLDGRKVITWKDSVERFPEGFVALESGRSDCSFDNVLIERLE